MSSLSEHEMHYEDLPFQTPKVVGKVKKMAKTTDKSVKAYKKSRGEHYKDIVIAVLVTSIIAFICGVQFASSQNAKVSTAVEKVEAAMTAETTEVPVKK